MDMRNTSVAARVVVVIFCLCAAAMAQPAQVALTIEGVDGNKLTFTVEQLRQMPQQSVSLANPDHRTAERYEGVLLRDLLAKLDTPIGKKMHADDMRTYVEVAGRDGYRVVFALAELDPSFQDNNVLVAISNESKPLDDELGPIRVIAPQDKRQGRSVRMVTAIALRRAP